MNMTPTLRKTQENLAEISRQIKEIAESLTQISMQPKKDQLLECVEKIKSANDSIEQSINFMYFGQKSGGQRKTVRKTKAVQENGKKGGRPSKKIVENLEVSSKDGIITVKFSDGTSKNIQGNIFAVREAFPITRYKWSDTAENLFYKISQN